MANPVLAAPAPPKVYDSLGIDRAFVTSMARVPLLAAGWVGLAWIASLIWEQFGPADSGNLGPMIVLAIGIGLLVSLLMIFVIPTFKDLFQIFGAPP